MKKQTILVIDGSGDCSVATLKTLGSLGFDIVLATTEKEGQHVLANNHPSLIISDCLVVPNPLMWIDKIQLLGLTTQVIAVTNDVRFDSIMDWVALGVFSVILRPLEHSRLQQLALGALEIREIVQHFKDGGSLPSLDEKPPSKNPLAEFYRGLIGHHDEVELKKQVATSVKKLTGAQWADVVFSPNDESTPNLTQAVPINCPDSNKISPQMGLKAKAPNSLNSYFQVSYKLNGGHEGNIKLCFNRQAGSTKSGGPRPRNLDKMDEAISLVSLALSSARKYSRAVELGSRDGLTNLYNRRIFNEMINQEFDKSQRYKLQLSLITFDLDHFKMVNDAFGHPTGDLVLKTVAQAMTSVTRSTDISARIGGEEFAIILPHTNLEQALILAQRLDECLTNRTFTHNGSTFKQTISQGIVSTEYFLVESVEDMVYWADQALYLAKREGRNTIRQASEVPMNSMMKESLNIACQAS